MRNITVKDYQAEINRKLCAAGITRDLKKQRKKALSLQSIPTYTER